MRRTTAALAILLITGCAPRRASERWQAVEVPTDADFTGIWFSDSLNGWLAGGGWAIDGGIIGRTRDGGRTWRFESGILGPAARGASLGRIQMRDSLHGCVTTGNRGILVTDDGGSNWHPANLGGASGGRLYDLRFLDAWNGWAAGTEIARSEDAGETWRTLIRGASENGYLSANAIQFLDTAHGWIAGQAGTLMRSEDGGIDWTPVSLPTGVSDRPTLWDVSFTDAVHGWVAGERGRLFRTADGGETWTLEQNGVPVTRVIPKGEPRRPRAPVPGLELEPDPLTLSAIRFADADHGWAVGYYADVAESVILSTADGGQSWKTEHVQPGEELRCLFVLDRDHAWAAGDRARRLPQVVLRCAGPPPGR